MLWTSERTLGVDDPVVAEQGSQPRSKGVWLGKMLKAAMKLQCAVQKCGLKTVGKFTAKHTLEHITGQKESARRADPTAMIWCQSSLRRLKRNVHEGENTHAHSTLSAEATEVEVFYPFHPLHGSTLQIQRKPKRGDGAASVIDRDGRRMKIPMWMLWPASADMRISEQALLCKEALLSLSALLAVHTHDKLPPIAVDRSEGGHRGATRVDGSDDPARNPSRARKPDRSGRSGRSDGALSGSSVSKRRRKV